MKTISDWREVLNRAWSVRAAIFTAFLAVGDQILGAFIGHIPPMLYGALMLVLIVLRVVNQP